METFIASALDKIFTEATALALVFALMWWLERKDRIAQRRRLGKLTNAVRHLASALNGQGGYAHEYEED